MELTDYQKGIALEIMQAENRGQAIKDIRKRKNITQNELARRLGYNSSSSIADIETGRRNNITVDSLVKYAVALSENGNGRKKTDFGIYPLDRRMKRY